MHPSLVARCVTKFVTVLYAPNEALTMATNPAGLPRLAVCSTLGSLAIVDMIFSHA